MIKMNYYIVFVCAISCFSTQAAQEVAVSDEKAGQEVANLKDENEVISLRDFIRQRKEEERQYALKEITLSKLDERDKNQSEQPLLNQLLFFIKKNVMSIGGYYKAEDFSDSDDDK